MNKVSGQRIFEGYAIGKIKVYSPHVPIPKKNGKGYEIEFERFNQARSQIVDYLEKLYQKMLIEMGTEEAEIFNIHKMMAEDLDFEDLVLANLKSENVTAEYACEKAGNDLASVFNQMSDEYMRERAADAIEVARRVISFLEDKPTNNNLDEPSIIVCEDIAPSEMVKFNKDLLLGIVCTKGSTNSHASILARMLEIPMIVGAKLDLTSIEPSTLGILDAKDGAIIINPNSEDLLKYQALRMQNRQEKEELKKLVGKKTATKDGRTIHIFANISSSHEVKNALKNDAEGIGLFRSEFLYLEAHTYPTEDEQFIQYKKVVEQMKPKEVIIRTLDIGADKKVDYFNLPAEENPALGYRSIRICKDRPDILLTQLTALYRASVYGNLSIMVPMIISIDEIKFVKEIAHLARRNLLKRGIPYNEKMPIGIMIETPAAAIIADDLAKEVDFFSIGTNDLTQYTLAIDRQNPLLTNYANDVHPALLRLIESVARAAKKHNIKVGICGELARDTSLTEFYIKNGIDELSVSPPYVLRLRKEITEMNLEDK